MLTKCTEDSTASVGTPLIVQDSSEITERVTPPFTVHSVCLYVSASDTMSTSGDCTRSLVYYSMCVYTCVHV